MSRSGRINRKDGRAVPAADEVEKLAHLLRFGKETLSRNDQLFVADCLDTLCNLASARRIHGAKYGDLFIEEVLALMLEEEEAE